MDLELVAMHLIHLSVLNLGGCLMLKSQLLLLDYNLLLVTQNYHCLITSACVYNAKQGYQSRHTFVAFVAGDDSNSDCCARANRGNHFHMPVCPAGCNDFQSGAIEILAAFDRMYVFYIM